MPRRDQVVPSVEGTVFNTLIESIYEVEFFGKGVSARPRIKHWYEIYFESNRDLSPYYSFTITS